jgi:drug/metabolite transporter (DMT)-like permease
MTSATRAFVVLTVVSTSKVAITKVLLTHLTLPVLYSCLSAAVTTLGILPVAVACGGGLTCLDVDNQDGIMLSSVAIGIDLVLANVALARLSMSLQQCIRATAPAITMLLEACYRGHRPRPSTVWPVIGICMGPIIMEARPSAVVDAWGVLAMLASVTASATKNVLAHGLIRHAKAKMSLLSYMFWVETFVTLLILPWAALTTNDLSAFLDAPPAMQAATTATAAYGGVRVLAQMLFLKYTSPTSLAVSNVAVQLLTTALGIILLGEARDAWTLTGALVAVASSLLYLRAKQRTAGEGDGERLRT